MTDQKQLANVIRVLAMDAVQQANSGHPGMPMGMADIATVLWNDFLHHSPQHPNWHNRDRFVLSNGHGSMLLYALLHLTGYEVSIDDLKQFRQLDSITPGHPECDITPGVETTTGPLGQGLANAVGMALAERTLASHYNRETLEVINHYTYVFTGDGCLMEGISHEACSLAGTLGLGKLIVFWDDNGISIDGDVSGWFSEDVAKRFESYEWQVIKDIDGHNPSEIHQAIITARENKNQPTLICCKTKIGFGSPNLAGSEKTHGAPLGAEEIAATRKNLNWEHPAFEIPTEIKSAWDAVDHGNERYQKWRTLWNKYSEAHPELAAQLQRRLTGDLPEHWQSIKNDLIEKMNKNQDDIASRKASLQCLEHLCEHLPELIGGSADLTGSNLTKVKNAKVISQKEADGSYIYYGVREFGMAAIMNGLSLHGGYIPFGGTFLTFLDYMRNAVRMAALMEQRSIFVFTHDSIGLGEDGPTHQPIEHLAMLRATPNVHTWRPADTVETAVAWSAACEFSKGPSCLALSRQTLPFVARNQQQINDIAKGGYILKECDGTPEIIIIATGSELSLALKASEQLSVAVRVVSMPCVEAYLQQSQDYQQSVLPDAIDKIVAIEAGVSDPWYRFVGRKGKVIGIDRFGGSAPAKDIFKACGLEIEQIVKSIKEWNDEY